MQLTALFELWVVTIYKGDHTDFVVQLGSQKPEVLEPFEGGKFYHLQPNDSVVFTNIEAGGDDPYATVMDAYPLYFRLETPPPPYFDVAARPLT